MKNWTKIDRTISSIREKNGENDDSLGLPLLKKAVVGSHASSLGFQCGGWTMAWQGQDGNKNAVGTKIFDGILAAVDPSTEITYSKSLDKNLVKPKYFSYAVVVVQEHPHAKSAGDN
ncbi:lysosomal beta glucosidase-like [Olea europaea subsp. europaea]|uniref:Lysosomal beta glucosidase-like n=1 Tax=Olea europaea subsp. europaea TaxID=158383 RepID=A0A8S0RHP9_OLEEU|nr:lysosomal beta glucosidase-like [Olea europaea subsp. europaea]